MISPSQLKAAVSDAKKDKYEKFFEFLWKALKGPPLVAQYSPIPGRKYKSDFAEIESKTLIEIDGGIWVRGGHSTGKGKSRDCEKDLEAHLLGWRTVRLVPEMITGHNIKRIIELLTK